MPVDAAQLARYRAQAPELLATVDLALGIMKKDRPVGQCGQLCEGLCAIQNKYGADFLGDSCHFYPRIVHAIGGRRVMVGSTSCPEMLRLILEEASPFLREEVTLARMPGIRRDILPEGATPAQVMAVMDEFMQLAADETRSPESILSQIIDSICEGMEAGASKPANAHAIYYALALTEAFTNAPRRERLDAVMQVMEERLGCAFSRDARTLGFAPDAANKLAQLNLRWHKGAGVTLAPMLRRWMQAQLAMTAFPFGGLADLSAFEHLGVLVQRFTTMRLALMCHVSEDGTLDRATAMRVVQVLSRFMDHLADAKLTRMIFRDLGWNTPAQLRQLIRI